MQKAGYRNSTLQTRVNTLKSVARRANLLHPEFAKAYLAEANVSEARKAKLVKDLAKFYAYKQIPFEKPYYRRIETLPLIPLESEIDQLISGLGKKLSTFLQLLKETMGKAHSCWQVSTQQR